MRNMVPEKTYFIHIPPQSEKHRERKLLNEIYDKYYKTVPVPDMEKEPWTYLQDDGYHLRGEGGIRIADQIEETMRKLEETQNPSQGSSLTFSLAGQSGQPKSGLAGPRYFYRFWSADNNYHILRNRN